DCVAPLRGALMGAWVPRAASLRSLPGATFVSPLRGVGTRGCVAALLTRGYVCLAPPGRGYPGLRRCAPYPGLCLSRPSGAGIPGATFVSPLRGGGGDFNAEARGG